MNIAVLLTCHNRKAKTVKCMQSLYDALTHYNRLHEKDFIDVEVYLTDDGCTDGTVEAVADEETIPFSNVTFFEPDDQFTITDIDDFESLSEIL